MFGAASVHDAQGWTGKIGTVGKVEKGHASTGQNCEIAGLCVWPQLSCYFLLTQWNPLSCNFKNLPALLCPGVKNNLLPYIAGHGWNAAPVFKAAGWKCSLLCIRLSAVLTLEASEFVKSNILNFANTLLKMKQWGPFKVPPFIKLIALFFFQVCISQWMWKGRKDSPVANCPTSWVPHGSWAVLWSLPPVHVVGTKGLRVTDLRTVQKAKLPRNSYVRALFPLAQSSSGWTAQAQLSLALMSSLLALMLLFTSPGPSLSGQEARGVVPGFRLASLLSTFFLPEKGAYSSTLTAQCTSSGGMVISSTGTWIFCTTVSVTWQNKYTSTHSSFLRRMPRQLSGCLIALHPLHHLPECLHITPAA